MHSSRFFIRFSQIFQKKWWWGGVGDLLCLECANKIGKGYFNWLKTLSSDFFITERSRLPTLEKFTPVSLTLKRWGETTTHLQLEADSEPFPEFCRDKFTDAEWKWNRLSSLYGGFLSFFSDQKENERPKYIHRNSTK